MVKRRKPKDNRIERKIITGMIVSSKFLKEIESIYKPEYITTGFIKIVANWCMEYYKQYGEAPGKTIEEIFMQHNENNDYDEACTEQINQFLVSISNDYSKEEDVFNAKYAADQTEKHFRLISLEHVKTLLMEHIVGGKVDEAEEVVKQFKRTTRPVSIGVNLICDKDNLIDTFDHANENILFKLRGDLGKVLGNFERDTLTAVLAPTKVGKSWYLQEIAIEALLKGFKVLFVSLEMSQKKMTTRIHMSLSALPLRECTVLVPVFDCVYNQNDTCTKRKRVCTRGIREGFKRPPVGAIYKDYKERYDKLPRKYAACTACKGTVEFAPTTWLKIKRKPALTKNKAIQKGRALRNSVMKGDKFRFLQFPSNTISMQDIRTHVANLEYYEGFTPDIICTDYADKMMPENRKLYSLDAELEIWNAHKALAQDKHCAVFTANQSNTVRTGANVGQGSWAGNIHKQAIVDGAFALNQKPEEKLNGLLRVTKLVERNDEFDVSKEVLVLQCLSIGKPYLDSYVIL